MKRISILCALALLAAGCNSAPEHTVSGLNPSDFAGSYNGAETALYTLGNDAGMEVCITNFGGRIVSLTVPDVSGAPRDVVLGFDNVTDYFPENHQNDFGAAIGRYANRIGGGRFTLDGTQYQLPQNNYGHCLHGGPDGWQYRVWQVVESSPRELRMQLTSPDGDSGFPGTVNATLCYSVADDNRLTISYEATTDAPTVINMTNHAYFNLSGDPQEHSITDDELYINASAYTPVDSTFMTLGTLEPVAGTPFDFTDAKTVAEALDFDNIQIVNGHGVDHNFVLDTAGDLSKPAAELYCPESGIVLTVYTDEPGIQIYSGNFLDGTVTGKRGAVYGQRHAICLETQHYPDSPNKPQWPSPVLRPGETYHSTCVYAFSTR